MGLHLSSDCQFSTRVMGAVLSGAAVLMSNLPPPGATLYENVVYEKVVVLGLARNRGCAVPSPNLELLIETGTLTTVLSKAI